MSAPDFVRGLMQRAGMTVTGKVPPADYESWLRELFPRYLKYPFAERHHHFWQCDSHTLNVKH